ncbi:hypothetical protein AB0O08_26830 [Streptomyces anulatus]|uniref:hypothetical protein n=1 Tax=Streptomyces anulatus TaxID=1892 RepID=UPI003424FACA
MVTQPVLEIFAADDCALWPVGEHESFGCLVLNGKPTPAEVGTAVMRIADRNGTDFVEPGRWNGLGTWRDWLDVLDGTGCAHFGHDPSSTAERVGDTVRLTHDAYGTDGSPVTGMPADRVRRRVADAQQDLKDFLGLAGARAEQPPPANAASVTAALARALDLAPSP